MENELVTVCFNPPQNVLDADEVIYLMMNQR